MHSYKHHIGDYTRDTVGLSMVEEGAYRRLIDQCYASELPLPEDVREIYRMARAASSSERKAVDFVLNRYFVLRDDGWRQNRVDRELAGFHGKSDKARTAADERWERERARKGDANAMRNGMRTHEKTNANASETQCEPDTSRERAGAGDQKPLAISHEPQELKTKAPPAGVLPETWDAWLRSKGKKQTADADRLQRKHLAEWAAQGQDPNAIVETAIAAKWSGLFPQRGRGPPNGGTQANRRTANIDRLTGQDRTQRNERFVGTAERVDRKVVPALSSDLREPPDDDVR